MHFWQGTDKCKNATIKYQNENVNKPERKRKLSLLDEFFIVLVRLKTGMFLLVLSERFDVSVSLTLREKCPNTEFFLVPIFPHFSRSVISKTFTRWIKFLYHELPLHFTFPSQKLVRKYLLKRFEKYPATRIIIDGTEIFVERATSMKTQAQT